MSSVLPHDSMTAPAWRTRFIAFITQNPKTTACFLLLSWILCHPWFGFWHDGLLYLGQALHQLYPQNYAHEMYFMHGSQDDYTLFTRVFAALIHLIGASPAGQILMLIANAMWFSLIYLIFNRMLADSRLAVVACLAAMILPAFYGGQNIFWFNEPFLTSRSYSELAALAGIYCLLGRRTFSALGWMLFATLLHPLMGLGGLLVWYVHLILRPTFIHARTWAISAAVLLLIAVAVMAFKHVGPFARLTLTYDQPWWTLVLGFNADVLLRIWSTDDWMLKGGPLILYVLYLRLAGPGRNRTLLHALVITAVLVALVSAMGGDWLRNVLVLSVQSWRAFWLFQAILPGFTLAWLMGHSRQLPLPAKWAATLAVLATLMRHYDVCLAFAALGLALTFVRDIPVRPQLARILNIALGLIVLMAVITSTLEASVFISIQFTNTRLQLLDAHMVAAAIFIVLIALCAWVSRPAFTYGLLLVFAVSTLATWDRRSPQEALFESAAATNPFSPLIPPQDIVLWNQFKPMPWLVLNRSTYANPMQGSAVLFNRDFAADFITRMTVLFRHYETKQCDRKLWATSGCDDSARTITPALCHVDHRINWIVSGFKAPYPVAAHWDIKTADFPNGLNLYSCKTWLALPYAPPAQAPAPAKASQ
ncbi:hypothetical protein [Amantichitinum ursilacus]|uniref:Uncharacterized protein n=1 Tax=Amantichitinum ursilacus TaxID=857265 RepID=A0A0N0XK22_9NEIS|nr:hypothetical protein [Amantichitinum ursilacus]KPC52268.1 hypothetical protein WG78_14450 [Amantichitinum ursilacus]